MFFSLVIMLERARDRMSERVGGRVCGKKCERESGRVGEWETLRESDKRGRGEERLDEWKGEGKRLEFGWGMHCPRAEGDWQRRE